MKYKTPWKQGTLNKKFWNEVFIGRKIKSLSWGKDGVHSLVLDNGEEVFGVNNTFGIETPTVERK